jgi:hypothetical protein
MRRRSQTEQAGRGGRGPAWRLGCALLLTLSLALLPGCTDPEASAYTEVTVGKLTVDRPSDWATELAVEEPWTQGFRLAPDSVEQQQVSGDFGEYPTAAAAMGTLIGQAQVGLKGFEIVESRDVEIKGATTGRVTRYTITDNTGSQLSGEWFVAAHWPFPQSVAVSVLQPQFVADLEPRILESMELKHDLQ